MPRTYDSARLRNQRAMDRRLATDHARLAQDIARLVVRAAQLDGTIPNSRSVRERLRTAIWEQVLKPYYIGRGTDALDGPRPQSPYALLIVEGIVQATRIQAERQAAIVRRLVKDEVVLQWLTGPRPMGLTEMQPVLEMGRITELLGPTAATMGGLRGADGRIDVDRARTALVRPRGMYEPFHEWVDPNGYRLSDRIWRASVDVRSRVDRLLDYHISRGTSAVEIADLLEPFLTPGALRQRTQRPYGTEGSYAARRLARTEITAAAGRATINASTANPFVQHMQWRLSASHPRIDICDQYARGGPNGDGIYPLGQVPPYPPHPHCLCSLLPVPMGNTADLVTSLRADIQAARGNLVDAVAGGNPRRARALQGILNPEYLTQAMMNGTLDEAVAAAVQQAQTVRRLPVNVQARRPRTTRATEPVRLQPVGTPVSNALTVAKGKYKVQIDTAIQAIDAVHGDGNLTAIPVKQTKTTSRFGVYKFQYVGNRSRPVEIGISTIEGNHAAMTTAHEIGHFLDDQALRITQVLPSDKITPEIQAWRDAVKNSEAVKTMSDWRRNGHTITMTDPRTGQQVTGKADSSYLAYVMRHDEMWARSYAQYVATRSQDPILLAELNAIRNEPYGVTQWADDDFEPIAKAIDAILKVAGWLR